MQEFEEMPDNLLQIDNLIQIKEASIVNALHSQETDDGVEKLKKKLYSLENEVRNKGVTGIVDCVYNTLMPILTKNKILSPQETLYSPFKSEETEIPTDLVNSSSNTVRILDLVHYMICPPVSGGILRILSPLNKIPTDSELSIDIIFSTWSIDYAKDCEEYLNKIPVIRYSKGVVVPAYNKDMPGKPDSLPQDVWKTISKDFLDYVCKLVSRNKYDIIQIEHSQLAWMVPALRIHSPSSKFVLDAHNVEYRVPESWIPYATPHTVDRVTADYNNMKMWEHSVWNLFDAAFTVSPIEEKILDQHGLKTYLVPTGGGIDPDKYAPRDESTEKKYDILYIGSMNWFPNTHGLGWFLHEVYPHIIKKRPHTNFQIVGNGTPDKELIKLAKSMHNVTFRGFQKDDVKFFHSAKVFVVPLWIGAGARVKIPTAWASKIPVVSTVFGAEGLPAINEQNIILSDDPAIFAEKIMELIDNPDYARRISENAFSTLCEKYTVDHCARNLIKAYKEIAKQGKCLSEADLNMTHS